MILLWLKVNFLIIAFYFIFKFLNNIFRFKNKFFFEKDCFSILIASILIIIASSFFTVEVPSPPVIHRNLTTFAEPIVQEIKILTQAATVKESSFFQYSFNWYSLFKILIFLGLTIWFFRFIKDLLKLKSLMNEAVLIKSYKNIKLYLCPGLRTPCSFWLPGKYFALFPEEVLIKPKDFTHALSHELQHHRQGDTKLIYLLEVFKGCFYFNLFSHFLINRFHNHREMKCDMEVLRRKKYDIQDYGNTLIDVINLKSGKVLQGTWAMASLTQITRRIEMITNLKKEKLKWNKRLIGLIFTSLLTWQALATSDSFHHAQKLNLRQVQSLINENQSEFPVEVNTLVLKWVNYFLTDPKGKAFIDSSLLKMRQYKKQIVSDLKATNMPLELLAVPLIESGYNISLTSPSGAAGIWQFMPQTARRFGLIVNKNKDERLETNKLTLTAIAFYQYLLNIEEFDKDWRLALLAYNTGEKGLLKAIEAQGTKNPWLLTNIGDKEYLAKMMAGIIILKKKL